MTKSTQFKFIVEDFQSLEPEEDHGLDELSFDVEALENEVERYMNQKLDGLSWLQKDRISQTTGTVLVPKKRFTIIENYFSMAPPFRNENMRFEHSFF